jgi:hypothetical protein
MRLTNREETKLTLQLVHHLDLRVLIKSTDPPGL